MAISFEDLIKQEQQRLVQEMYTVDFDYFKRPWITYGNHIKPNCIVKL